MNKFDIAEVSLHLKLAGNHIANNNDSQKALDNIKAALSILGRG